MSDATRSLLLTAMSDNDAEATSAWRSWRGTVDIQHLTWPDMQILPLLNGPRLDAWLADDPSAGILTGIVRRVWTEAQVRLGTAREVLSCLRKAGCNATVTSALGAYLRQQPSTAIRPVLELRMLIRRDDVATAAAALLAAGWQVRDEIPSGSWLDNMTHGLWTRNGMRLYLHWRLLRVPSSLSLTCEREFLAEHVTVEAIGTQFRLLTPAHALIETLAEREETVDALAWQADAALLLRGRAAARIDWKQWAAKAARYDPTVFERLSELRAMGLSIPQIREPKPSLSEQMQHAWQRLAGSVSRRHTATAGRH